MISIITPAYNAETLLDETIESVLGQTYQDWELIIVDDCSSDGTYEAACKWQAKDARIRVIRHEQNRGVAAARNTALEAATGDYIAFLDSDDLWLPEKLEKQLAFMEENDYVLTYTKYKKYFGNGREGKEMNVPPRMTYTDIFKNTAIACLTVMVNRKKAGPFYMPPLKHTEDQCTWQDILKRGYVAYALDETLALYRVSENSLTSNKSKVIKRQWNTYRKFYKFSLVKSGYYFLCYAVNAVRKHS